MSWVTISMPPSFVAMLFGSVILIFVILLLIDYLTRPKPEKYSCGKKM